MGVAETNQQKGIDGVERTKRWLESTTWIELPWNAYDNASLCTLRRLDGGEKTYDLFGELFTDPKTPLYVENKDYSSPGGSQPKEYWLFLSNAYSITAADCESTRGDARREFMWVTTYPFEQTDWATLTSPTRIAEALQKDAGALNGRDPDASLLSVVSDRLWLLVIHERQERLMLTPAELSLIESQLNRKGRK